MSKHIILGAKTSGDARDLLRGARWAAQQAANFKSGVPRRGPGDTLPKEAESSVSHCFAVVMEAIPESSDVEADPPDGFGKVKILDKEYKTKDENGDPVEPEYDDAACFELAESEKILKGVVVELLGPFKYDNPDYDENAGESDDNPKKKKYYQAVHTEAWYTGPSSSELRGPDATTTIEVKNGDESETFDVLCPYLPLNQYYPDGTRLTVTRSETHEGRKLIVWKAICPKVDDEESTPAD